MALRTVSNTGGNWNATTAWVGGVVPIAGDTVAFTATSGNLVVNVATVVLAGINFTNYANTITFTAAITSTGTINLGTNGFTQAGASGLIVSGTATISGTTVWSRTLTFTGTSITYTLGSNLTITGAISLSGTTASTFTGNTLNIGGSLTVTTTATISGTTTFNFNGTGTWNHTTTGVIRNNVTINTAGTLTIGTNIYYNTGTLTYTAGTVTTTGSTLNISTTTLNTVGMTWNNIVYTGGTTTITLSSNLVFIGTFTITNSGTTTITLAGAGIIDSPNGTLQLTVSGANLTLTTSATHNILNYQLNAGGFAIIASGTWNVYGDLIRNGGGAGVSAMGTVNLIGTGSVLFNGGATGALSGNININTLGTITFGSVTFPNVYYSLGTLTYIRGKVVAKNSTLTLATSTLINCHKINFDKVIASGTITMNEFFSGSPSLVTKISGIHTITFQDGFEKIAKFVNISGCTLTRPLQLLVLTKSKINSTNIGIRYINQSPNGIAKGEPSVNLTTFGAGGLLPDPTNL